MKKTFLPKVLLTFCLSTFLIIFSTVNNNVDQQDRTPSSDNDWESISNGRHSFLSLGEDYSVPLQMKKVEDAEVVLINERVARMLGLTTPDDIKDFQKIILDQFAYMVDKSGDKQGDQKEWFATRYQDSHTKEEGAALGDGRAAWAGEIILNPNDDINGTKRHVDVVLKGIGQTPLAWTNHGETTHKDGLQGLKDAIHSFVISEANAQNQLDTTIDLAVIKLPIKRLDKNGNEAVTAITVRVGNQTRLAHLRYFTDQPQKFARIFRYIVKRDLGLSEDAHVKTSDIDRFLGKFTENLAEEMASYYDLHITHGSPTPGNRTTSGSSIDLSTMRYHEAHHGNYSYLGGMTMKKQSDHLQAYIRYLYRYMEKANYPYEVSEAIIQKMELKYRKLIDSHLEKIWLARVGLSELDIKKLKPKTRKRFVTLVKEMYELEGKENITYAGKTIKPAALDMRAVLRETSVAYFAALDSGDSSFDSLLLNSKDWSSLSSQDLSPYSQRYFEIISALAAELNLTNSDRQRWIRKSKHLNKNDTDIRVQSELKAREKKIYESMLAQDGDVEKWSRHANSLALELKDPARPQRAYNNLGKFVDNSNSHNSKSKCQKQLRKIIFQTLSQ
jgi:hypothetical protein